MERKLLDMMNQLFISEYNTGVEYGAQFQFVKLKILSIERNALLHTLFAGGGQRQRTVCRRQLCIRMERPGRYDHRPGQLFYNRPAHSAGRFFSLIPGNPGSAAGFPPSRTPPPSGLAAPHCWCRTGSRSGFPRCPAGICSQSP